MSALFVCSPGCDGCCRYSSWLLSEIPSVSDVVFGLRLSLHISDSGGNGRARRLNRDMSLRFPLYESVNGGDFFFEARIVDAGMERSLHGKCPDRKKVWSGNGCKRAERPAWCRSAPFNASLPLFIQDEHLFYMKDAMGCPGGLHPNMGVPLFSPGRKPFFLFGGPRILHEERGRAFTAIQDEQKKLLPLQETLLELILQSWGESSMEKLCTGTTRDAMALVSMGPLVQSCVMNGVWDMGAAVKFFENQLFLMNEAEQKFGEKYGEKKVFPKRTRQDGQEGVAGRKEIFTRQASWKKEYLACLAHYNQYAGVL